MSRVFKSTALMGQHANSRANLTANHPLPKVAVGECHARWEILSRAENSSDRKRRWLCRCSCGAEKIVYEKCLLNGDSSSCGCFAIERRTKHGCAVEGQKSREYGIYYAMLQRCHNTNHSSYPQYGGAGISVCERWRESFENFLADMGVCPEKQTIERIDGKQGYGPNNCKWATYGEQARNKSTNIIVDVHGEKMCITDWAKKIGMAVPTIMYRWRKWKDVDRVENTPLLHPYYKGERV